MVDASGGDVLGLAELERAYSTVHEGAVYLHLGRHAVLAAFEQSKYQAILSRLQAMTGKKATKTYEPGADSLTCIDELDVTLGSAPTWAADPDATQPDFKGAKAIAVAQFERTYLRDLLIRTNGNVSLAARLARKDRSALKRLVKKHGIAPHRFRAS